MGHSISSAGSRPNAEKVSALTNMPVLTDVKQVRALMVGVNYYLKCFSNYPRGFARLMRSFRKGVKFAFTPAMEKLVREVLAGLTTPPVLVFHD